MVGNGWLRHLNTFLSDWEIEFKLLTWLLTVTSRQSVGNFLRSCVLNAHKIWAVLCSPLWFSWITEPHLATSKCEVDSDFKWSSAALFHKHSSPSTQWLYCPCNAAFTASSPAPPALSLRVTSSKQLKWSVWPVMLGYAWKQTVLLSDCLKIYRNPLVWKPWLAPVKQRSCTMLSLDWRRHLIMQESKAWYVTQHGVCFTMHRLQSQSGIKVQCSCLRKVV